MTGVALQYLKSGAAAAGRLARRLDVGMHEIEAHRFPDGELRVAVGPSAPTTIVYAPLDAPNEKLLALLFAAEALRRGGANRLVLVAPYLCYMRQDAAFRAGEAISQKVIGSLLARTFDRLLTVDAHLHRTHRIEDVFPGAEAEDLSAMPTIAGALQGIERSTIVIGPDSESEPWVADLAGRLGLEHAVAHKTRCGDRSVTVAFADPAAVKGRPALVVDDIVSSGGTLIACAKALIGAGATSVDAVITHALFPAAMTDEFKRAGIRSIRSTSSVPHPTNAIMLDDVLASALAKEGMR